MNIFALDADPMTAALYHCDKHCVKMVLETAQMLCTNINLTGVKSPYKSCHLNHPCTVWTRKSRSNFIWLCELGLSLCMEYTFRYNKVHASESVINFCYEHRHNIDDGSLTDFALAMPDEFKVENTVQSYRNYYVGAKREFAIWSKRSTPDWFV